MSLIREGVIPPHFPRMPTHENTLISAESVPIAVYHAIVWFCLRVLGGSAFLSALAHHLPQAKLSVPKTPVSH